MIEVLKREIVNLYYVQQADDYDSHELTQIVKQLLIHLEQQTNYEFDIDQFGGEFVLLLFNYIFIINDKYNFIGSKNEQ